MSDRDDLQELHGVGPAVETRLHEAGITDLAHLAGADPAAIAAAVAGLRGMTDERIAAWIAEAAQRTAASPGEPSSAERRETFVLTLVIGPDGEVTRSALRHVRTDAERSWPGWRHDELDRFVAASAGMTGAADAAAREPLPALTLHHDLGLVVGGRRTAIGATVDAAPLEERDIGDFAYRAVLSARVIGEVQPRAVTWHAGTADTSRALDVTFPDVELRAGVHRMEVVVEVTPLVRTGSDA
ncbi:MAG: helix-hairpin-helix domain-containing protein [Actinomycetota bacterium]